MARVWVVGSLNVDRSWRVARHPGVGETVMGESLAPQPGGKGLNQAVAAARMGADVVLVGRVGDDDDGRWLRDVAAAEGIDVAAVSTNPDASTGSALIVIDEAGANTVTVDPGANQLLAAPDDLGLVAGDVVVAQLEVPAAAVDAIFAAAARLGAVTVLNPSPLDRASEVHQRADVVVVNQPEAAALAGSSGEAVTVEAATAEAAIDQGRAIAARDRPPRGGTVIVTLGAAGAVAVSADPGSAPMIVAAPIVAAVDTTGAGDCFLGVLAAGLAQGLDLAAALDRANRAASISVTRLGTVAAMPTADELS